MFFGLPWFAVVAIVAIVGGLFVRYREQELQMESNSIANLKELRELQKTVLDLQHRIENLEAIVTEEDSFSPDIEFGEEPMDQEQGEKNSSIKTKTS